MQERSAELENLVSSLLLTNSFGASNIPSGVIIGHQRDRQQRRFEREEMSINPANPNSARMSATGFSVISSESSSDSDSGSHSKPMRRSHGTSSQSGSESQSVSRAVTSSDSASVSPRTQGPDLSNIIVSRSHNQAIDAVVSALQPHENQLLYRCSAMGFVKKQIRAALNCSAFDVGLHELRCNLPDDSIRVTTVLCKNQLSSWQRTLCDALSSIPSSSSSSSESVDQYYELLDPEYRPLVDHAVSGVNVTNDQMNYQVNCLLDAQLDVEIVVNARGELCMLAFLEEFSSLVGQDNLFKRSLLLIRAWWVYETASY
eukprot:gene30505-37733_t